MLFNQIEYYSKIVHFEFEKVKNDDFVDKLSRKFSFAVLIIFGTVLGISQLVGNPISCVNLSTVEQNAISLQSIATLQTFMFRLVMNQVSLQTWIEYFIFVDQLSNLFTQDIATYLPKREDLQSHRILYYQWVPYIFLFQAFLFYMPSILWSLLLKKTEFDIDSYVDALKDDKCDKDLAVNYVASNFYSSIRFRNNYEHRGVKRFFGSSGRLGFFLTVSHLLIKLLYASVALFQIFIMNYWFRDDYHVSRQDKFSYLFGAHNWRLGDRFPRMTLCKFQVYILQDPQIHWVQCALPQNIYIEKMYMIVAVWSLVLFILTLFKAIKMLITTFTTRSDKFVLSYLEKFSEPSVSDENTHYNLEFNSDEMLALRLIQENTSRNVVAQIIRNLCNKFK